MKIHLLLAGFITTTLCGCTQHAAVGVAYDIIQEQQQHECRKKPQSLQETCLDRHDTGYNEYLEQLERAEEERWNEEIQRRREAQEEG